jgi:catechol 2,3-dioxygenase-like lactoylglutathione lyase family enzyme
MIQGIDHVNLVVDDLATMVGFLGEVQQVPDTQVDYADVRKRLVYFRDPEGNLLEMCCYE